MFGPLANFRRATNVAALFGGHAAVLPTLASYAQGTTADGSAGLTVNFAQALTAGQTVLVAVGFDDSAGDGYGNQPMFVGGGAATLIDGPFIGGSTSTFLEVLSGVATGGETGIVVPTFDPVRLNVDVLVFNNSTGTSTASDSSSGTGTSLSNTLSGGQVGIATVAVGAAADPTFGSITSPWVWLPTNGGDDVWTRTAYLIGTPGVVEADWTTSNPAAMCSASF